MKAAQVAAFVGCLTLLLPRAIGNQAVPFKPDHITGTVTAKKAVYVSETQTRDVPALSYDMSLNADGRLDHIKINFEGKSFDMITLPGAEKIKQLTHVDLFAFTFLFEAPSPEIPAPMYLLLAYRPWENQPECPANEQFQLIASLTDAQINRVEAHCDERKN